MRVAFLANIGFPLAAAPGAALRAARASRVLAAPPGRARFPILLEIPGRNTKGQPIDPKLVRDTAADLYIRALKILPPDVKAAFARAHERESHPGARKTLGVMLKNLEVAESRGLMVCQDTGAPVYTLRIGRDTQYDGLQLLAAIEEGVKQATAGHPLRSSMCHPIDRRNPQTNTGGRIPAIDRRGERAKARIFSDGRVEHGFWGGTGMTEHILTTPLTEIDMRALRAGDIVALDGLIFGLRDATLLGWGPTPNVARGNGEHRD